jgi:plasmid stabilization system protein ParE
VAQVSYARRALADFERIFEFIAHADPYTAGAAVGAIRQAIEILEYHPLIGRPAERGLRELVISRGRTGYLALYEFLPELDTVLVLALRHQREAGFEEVDG